MAASSELELDWVAVKELESSYYNSETLLLTMYPNYSNLFEVPEQQPSKRLTFSPSLYSSGLHTGSTSCCDHPHQALEGEVVVKGFRKDCCEADFFVWFSASDSWA